MSNILEQFNKKKNFLICIDSDGLSVLGHVW